MRDVVLIGDRLFMKFPDQAYFSQRAAEADARIVSTQGMNRTAILDAARRATALVVIGAPIDRELIAAATSCRLIMTLSVGYDVVDVAAATERRIPVSNCPMYCSEEVADHALMLILTLTRKLHAVIPATRAGGWSHEPFRAIHAFRAQTLGIVGLGRIGRHLARKSAALGFTVCAYDPYLDDDLFALLHVQRCYELPDLLMRADVISLHAPLTDETYRMIDAGALSQCKGNAVLINTARGPLVDEDDLAAALRDGTIAGAGIDVFAVEPPPADHPLLATPNTVVTPHMAWYSEQSHRVNLEQGMDELVRVLRGERPRFIVNPQVLSRRAV